MQRFAEATQRYFAVAKAPLFVSLATVGRDGCPKNRTVVFRGFIPETNYIKFTTDLRTEKVQELKLNPNVEICWYFGETREQFRIAGKVEVLSYEDARAKQVFEEDITESARATFSWPTTAVGQLAENLLEDEFPPDLYPRKLSPQISAENEKHFVHAIQNFGLLILLPEKMNHVHLQNNKVENFDFTVPSHKC